MLLAAEWATTSTAITRGHRPPRRERFGSQRQASAHPSVGNENGASCIAISLPAYAMSPHKPAPHKGSVQPAIHAHAHTHLSLARHPLLKSHAQEEADIKPRYARTYQQPEHGHRSCPLLPVPSPFESASVGIVTVSPHSRLSWRKPLHSHHSLSVFPLPILSGHRRLRPLRRIVQTEHREEVVFEAATIGVHIEC
ncbi:hypothetical protein K438DRAFT_1974617 [Mycena galopus ATCC 62051]|nr:hypothetical protein K438DRAFT_1974617 [Mycena galopus ATCC 62051]